MVKVRKSTFYLAKKKVYILPDGYEVQDASLEDIKVSYLDISLLKK